MNGTYIFIVFIILAVFVGLLLIYMSQELKRQYKREVSDLLKGSRALENRPLTQKDIVHLPEPVQRYLAYVGVIGEGKVHNVKINFEGKMKMGIDKDWVDIIAEQYNSFENHTRLFFIKGAFKGIPYFGLHSYGNGKASMVIKIIGLFPIVAVKGEDMLKAETVTVLNDMCLFAPAALVDRRITWEAIDPLTVKASFNNNGYIVSAVLYFNEEGQLINFVSDDRYKMEDDGSLKKAKWSTPIKFYKNIKGLNLPGEPDVINTSEISGATWHLSEVDYCYAKFKITDINYNC